MARFDVLGIAKETALLWVAFYLTALILGMVNLGITGISLAMSVGTFLSMAIAVVFKDFVLKKYLPL